MDSNEQLVERIKQVMADRGVSGREFARQIGADTSNFSKYMNGRIAVSEALLNRIVVNLGVSKQWLTEGDGTMYAHPGLVTSSVPGVTLTTERKGLPVYDIDVTAGKSPRALDFTDDNLIGWIDMPALADSQSKVVRVSGDSMYPTICNGDWLAVREVSNPDIIAWGEIYVVQLDDYRMVKYLRRHDDRRMVIMRSENRNYDDIEIPRAAIRELMIVTSIIHFSSRM